MAENVFAKTVFIWLFCGHPSLTPLALSNPFGNAKKAKSNLSDHSKINTGRAHNKNEAIDLTNIGMVIGLIIFMALLR